MEQGGAEVLPFAGTGFRDTTRVGASPPEKWVAVVMDNSENLTRDLGSLIQVLTNIKTIVSSKDREALLTLLEDISSYRRRLEPATPTKRTKPPH
jgi:prephenate dehydrogenase